ncbi:hypothetical protein BD769DRAFT_1313171, partial [Suillus cothurnatus]
KNATQHPGYILTGGEDQVKRCTKAQKAADDQREKEEKKASETAIQEGHKCIAAFQKQMQANQATVCTDAPKPTHPHPRPVKKGAKALETSNLTTAAEKAVGAKGKGGRAAASANVEHPASEDDEELEVQMPEACKKKGKRTVILVKTPVRDAINVVGALIDKSMQAHDDESSDAISMQAPKKYSVVDRIPVWRERIPEVDGSKPSSIFNLKNRRSAVPSTLSSTAPSSKLTRGSTISSAGAPLTPTICTPDAGANDISALFTTLFADDELTESVEHSQALTCMSKSKAAQVSL